LKRKKNGVCAAFLKYSVCIFVEEIKNAASVG
jgi:hypothetical protein